MGGGQEKTKKMRLRWGGAEAEKEIEKKRGRGREREEGWMEGGAGRERRVLRRKPQAPGNGASSGNSNVRVAYPEDVVT